MPLFEYSAINANGEVTENKIEAANPADATNQLRASGLFPKQVVEAGKGKLKPSKKGRKIGRTNPSRVAEDLKASSERIRLKVRC